MHYIPTRDLFPGATQVGVNTLPVKQVMDLPLVDASAEAVIRRLLDATRKTASFITASCMKQKAENQAYAAALCRTDYLLPAGTGIAMAAKLEGTSFAERLNGADFTQKLLQAAARQDKSVFLISNRPGAAESASRRLCRHIPGLRIAGTHTESAEAERDDTTTAAINASGADIVLVAMGMPVQEIWIDRHRDALDACLVLGVGTQFDDLAEDMTCAPIRYANGRMDPLWELAMGPNRAAWRNRAVIVASMARAA